MQRLILVLVLVMIGTTSISAQSVSSDSLEDNIVYYYKRNKLIIVPGIVNDSIVVNFILDPACKTVVLFGRRFEKLKKQNGNESNQAKNSPLSLHNKITIGPHTSRDITIAIVPNQDAINFITSVEGIIGYNFFSDYDITINRKKQFLKFSPIAQGAVAKKTDPVFH